MEPVTTAWVARDESYSGESETHNLWLFTRARPIRDPDTKSYVLYVCGDDGECILISTENALGLAPGECVEVEIRRKG